MLWSDIPTTCRELAKYLLKCYYWTFQTSSSMVKKNRSHTQLVTFHFRLLHNEMLVCYRKKISLHAVITVVRRRIVWESWLLDSCWLRGGCCWLLGSRTLSQRLKTSYKVTCWQSSIKQCAIERVNARLSYMLAARGLCKIKSLSSFAVFVVNPGESSNRLERFCLSRRCSDH